MAIVAAAPVVLPRTGLGAPFPGATVIKAPEQVTSTEARTRYKECFVRYRLKTAAPIAMVANFYRTGAEASGAKLFDDSGNKFPDQRMLMFLQPHFMFVILKREYESTTVSVTYKVATNCGMKDHWRIISAQCASDFPGDSRPVGGR